MAERMYFRVLKIRKPDEKSINTDLQWIGQSLGLFGERDKEKSCFRLFLEFLKASRLKKQISSDELALRSKLSRGTVVHHLHRLEDSGLIINFNNKYILREPNLENLVIEMRKDLLRALQDIQDIAQDLDEELGLIKRQKSTISKET